MAKVRVEFEIELPDVNGEVNDDKIEEWLRFSYGDNGCMSCDNPFVADEPEPIFGTFEWEHA